MSTDIVITAQLIEIDDEPPEAEVVAKQNGKFKFIDGCSANLKSLFECTGCKDYVFPTIYQCPGGHLMCSTCRTKLRYCRICGSHMMGQIRNLAMEQIVNSMSFSCKYYGSNGCTRMLLHTEKLLHEKFCEFRPYICPCTYKQDTSCKWQGGLNEIFPHLKISHKNIMTMNGADITFRATDILKQQVDTSWVMLQACFGFHFILILKKQNNHFFAFVQLIGSQKEAEKFSYRMELGHKSVHPHRRLLTWESTPRLFHGGIDSALRNTEGLVLDANTAKLFTEKDLDIKVIISFVVKDGSKKIEDDSILIICADDSE